MSEKLSLPEKHESEAPELMEGTTLAPPAFGFSDDSGASTPPPPNTNGGSGDAGGGDDQKEGISHGSYGSSAETNSSGLRTASPPPFQLTAPENGSSSSPAAANSTEVATSAESSNSKETADAPAVDPQETISLEGGSFQVSEAMATFIESSGGQGASVRVQIGSMASGMIKVKKSGDGYSTTSPQECAVAVNNRLAGMVVVTGAQLVAVIEISGNAVSGYHSLKIAGNVIPMGEVQQWFTNNASSLGLAGFDGFGAPVSITNEIAGDNSNYQWTSSR